MGLSLNLKIFIPGMNFTCKKCGIYCDGENFFISGQKILRWCDECGHLEEGQVDSHSDLGSSNLNPPENYDFLLSNPVIEKRRIKHY